MLRLNLILLLFILLTVSVSTSQTIIDTKSDNQFIGIIISNENNTVQLKTLEGVTVNIPNKEIDDQYEVMIKVRTKFGYEYSGKLIDFNDSLYIINDRGIEYNIPANIATRLEIFNDYIRSIRFDKINSDNLSYSSLNFGMGLSIIGSGSFMIGYDYNDFGMRFMLSIVPLWEEKNKDVRLSCLYNIGRNDYFEHNISLGFGFLDADQYNGSYTGFFYDISVYCFFLEAGTFFPNDDDEEPEMLVQFGCMFRF